MTRVDTRKDLARTLQDLGKSSRSGVVSVTSKEGSALIVMQSGGVVYASSDRVAPIGRTLVAKGIVDAKTLEKVLMLQRVKKERQLLVGMLCELGLVERDTAAAEIEDHIVSVLRDTLAWPEYEIHFDPAQGDLDRIVFPPANGNVNILLHRARS